MIVDGMGGAASLESADTPFLDELAQKGETGLLEWDVELGLAGEIRSGHDLSESADRTLAALRGSDAVQVRLRVLTTSDIERVDRLFFGALMKTLVGPGFLVAVAGGDGQRLMPLLVSGGTLEPEGALQFGETDAARGRLGRLLSSELAARLSDLASG